MNPSKSQSLGVFSLCAIGVGLVISGESFGWNIGWGIIGAKSFFIPVLIAATLYFCLVKNLIELTCVYPHSDGPQTFAELAYGKIVGNFIAIVLLVEFLFAIPAVANAISEYLGFLFSNHDFDLWIASAFLLVFCIINYFHISLKIKFVILLTILAILELNIFSFSILPEFSFKNFTTGSHENLNIQNILLALPYAAWMFLAIEGLSLFTKYVDYEGFRAKISAGYIYSILTLFVFCSVILMLAGGSIVWNEESWHFITSNDYPMPAILAAVLGKNNIIVRIFTFLGLFGLISSFQGVISVAIMQCKNILEWYITIFSKIAFIKERKNILTVLLVFIFGLASVWGSETKVLIEFSVFSAASLYIGINFSLLKLRKNNFSNSGLKDYSSYKHSDFNFSNIYIFISSFLSIICTFVFAYQHINSFFVFVALSIFYFLHSFYLKAEQEKQQVILSYNVLHTLKNRVGIIRQEINGLYESYNRCPTSDETRHKIGSSKNEGHHLEKLTELAYLAYFSSVHDKTEIYNEKFENGLKFTTTNVFNFSDSIKTIFDIINYNNKNSYYKSALNLTPETHCLTIEPYFKLENNKDVRLFDGVYEAILFEIIHNFFVHSGDDNGVSTLSIKKKNHDLVFINQSESNDDLIDCDKITGGLAFIFNLLKNTESGAVYHKIINSHYEITLKLEGLTWQAIK